MAKDSVVLVTGGAGYIGSHAVLALRDAGIGAVVVDDLSTGRRDAVPAEVPLVEGSVGDRDLVADTIARHRVTAIMHFAASIVVPDSVTQPLDYYRNNTVNSHALMQTCLQTGVRHFIFSSTAAVYGIPETLPVREDAPTLPINPYGTSKLMTEWMLRDAGAAHDLRHVVLRYFNVAGADPQGRAGESTPEATHLIKVACEVALGRRLELLIFGDDYPTPDGTGVRDYIDVGDLVDAHILALRYLEAGKESVVLNCGYGRGYSVREVVGAVERASGTRLPVRIAPRRPGDPAVLIAANDRIRAVLHWSPRHQDLDLIARTALAWERRQAPQGQRMRSSSGV